MRFKAAVLILSVTIVLAALGAPTLALHSETVIVTFAFPDGSSKVTELNDAEVRSLLHESFGYMVEWWIRGALIKLGLPHRIAIVDQKLKAKDVVAIGGVENSQSGHWVLYVNGFRSPYHINTQSRENVREIRLAFQSARKPAG